MPRSHKKRALSKREPQSSDIDIDLRHVAEVLGKIKSPLVRYQLTMIVDFYAAKLQAAQRSARAARARSPVRKKKSVRAGRKPRSLR